MKLALKAIHYREHAENRWVREQVAFVQINDGTARVVGTVMIITTLTRDERCLARQNDCPGDVSLNSGP